MSEIVVEAGSAGLSIWLMAAVIAGALIILTNALWLWYWMTMRPVGGYFTAVRGGQTLSILVTRVGKLKFTPVSYIGNVLTNMGLKMSWLVRSPDSWQLGAVPTKLVIDSWGIGADPKLQVAVKTIIGDWNKEHPDNKIETYDDLREKIMKKQIDDPVLIPAVAEVPIYEIERYLPRIDSSGFEGHIQQRAAELIGPMKGTELPGWIKIFLILEMAVVAFGGIIFLLGM